MANVFYDPGRQRAQRVQDLFARIASRYDLINDLQSFGLHRFWKKRVVSLARPARGKKGLDVCCGTGDLALALAKEGMEVVGLDFTPQMLEVARKRVSLESASKPGLDDQLQFKLGDAEAIPFAEDTFDVVTVGYGLRNLTRWETGVREMVRVAKPGGCVVVLDFGKPDNALWRWLYFSYLKCFVPVLGWLFAGSASAYGYILESLKHYPAQRGVEATMLELGLRRVTTTNILGGIMAINYGEKPPKA